ELLKTVGPLTDPTTHGGGAEDAFDLVLPSMPGYGFSGKPTDAGWGPDRIAQTWAALMSRLGYTRYVAQGGDWGRRSRAPWRARRRPACSASISICRQSCRRRSPRCSPPADRRRRDLPRRSARRSTRSAPPPKWGTDPTPR